MLRRGRVCLVAAGCFISEPAVRGVWGELPSAWGEGTEVGDGSEGVPRGPDYRANRRQDDDD